jgi:hypothetical protein
LQDQRLQGGLVHMVEHPDDDLARALDHAEDRRLLGGPRAASRLPWAREAWP